MEVIYVSLYIVPFLDAAICNVSQAATSRRRIRSSPRKVSAYVVGYCMFM